MWPVSSCRLAPPSTWTARPCTKRSPPSSSRRFAGSSWLWVALWLWASPQRLPVLAPLASLRPVSSPWSWSSIPSAYRLRTSPLSWLSIGSCEQPFLLLLLLLLLSILSLVASITPNVFLCLGIASGRSPMCWEIPWALASCTTWAVTNYRRCPALLKIVRQSNLTAHSVATETWKKASRAMGVWAPAPGTWLQPLWKSNGSRLPCEFRPRLRLRRLWSKRPRARWAIRPPEMISVAPDDERKTLLLWSDFSLFTKFLFRFCLFKYNFYFTSLFWNKKSAVFLEVYIWNYQWRFPFSLSLPFNS